MVIIFMKKTGLKPYYLSNIMNIRLDIINISHEKIFVKENVCLLQLLL